MSTSALNIDFITHTLNIKSYVKIQDFKNVSLLENKHE